MTIEQRETQQSALNQVLEFKYILGWNFYEQHIMRKLVFATHTSAFVIEP